MAPSSERRHRIQGSEVPAVARAVWERLSQLVDARRDQEEAELLYRVLHRLTIHRPGQPNYGRFSWARATSLLVDSREEWYH